MKLKDVAAVIRSKNAGPYEITFDIIFKDKDSFDQAVAQQIITPSTIARLYSIDIGQVISVIEFPPALAIKASIIRPIGSGDPGERDVYSAQQHAPLMDIEVNLD